jgi:hypothetical protein
MRHVLLLGAITAGARGMQKPTAMACLIAPAGGTLCLASSPTGALTRAVNVATIATAADHHPGAATCTEKQPCRDGVVSIEPAGPLMTGTAIAAILPSPPATPAPVTSRPALLRTANSGLPLTLAHIGGTQSRAAALRRPMTFRLHVTVGTIPTAIDNQVVGRDIRVDQRTRCHQKAVSCTSSTHGPTAPEALRRCYRNVTRKHRRAPEAEEAQFSKM